MKTKPTYQELEKELEVLRQKMEMKECEEKFRELFEKSGDAILIIENERFVDCNQATVEMLCYKNKTEFLQTHPSELSSRGMTHSHREAGGSSSRPNSRDSAPPSDKSWPNSPPISCKPDTTARPARRRPGVRRIRRTFGRRNRTNTCLAL